MITFRFFLTSDQFYFISYFLKKIRFLKRHCTFGAGWEIPNNPILVINLFKQVHVLLGFYCRHGIETFSLSVTLLVTLLRSCFGFNWQPNVPVYRCNVCVRSIKCLDWKLKVKTGYFTDIGKGAKKRPEIKVSLKNWNDFLVSKHFGFDFF